MTRLISCQESLRNRTFAGQFERAEILAPWPAWQVGIYGDPGSESTEIVGVDSAQADAVQKVLTGDHGAGDAQQILRLADANR